MSEDPAAYFINTDAHSLGDVSPHDDWFTHRHAFTGGDIGFGRKLGGLKVGDLLLMWANGLGVIGIGRVSAPWDGRVHDVDAWIYIEPYKGAGPEYRIPVDWFLDLRRQPIPTAEIKARGIQNSNPRAALSEIANVAAVNATITALADDQWEPEPVYPDEVEPGGRYAEGATRQVLVNAYERNPRARAACLRLHGRACAVCGIDFGVVYGAQADGLIHVHHLHQLADAGGPCEVDPASDLIPICPNCHAVIHARPSPYSPEEVRQMRATASADRRVE